MAADPLKEITKVLWSLGNYNEIAKVSMPAAMQLVDAAGVDDGHEVLDVATGNGNVALLAAQRGALVSACDITPAMLELAADRAESEHVKIELVEADVESLPYEDDRFDFVLSTFGAMFATDPSAAASEMFRVARPGGTVGMASWTPDGLMGKQLALMTSYAPGGGLGPDPTIWGTEEGLRERLAPHAESMEIMALSLRLEYESWDELVAFNKANLGPAIALKEALEPERYEEMFTKLRALYDSYNQTEDDRIVADGEYLQVLARKRS